MEVDGSCKYNTQIQLLFIGQIIRYQNGQMLQYLREITRRKMFNTVTLF